MRKILSLFAIGLTIIVSGNVFSATPAELNMLGVISVKMSINSQPGAAGDGVTDDTAAIQRAIDKARKEAKIVLFPAGTYLVSNTLECYKPVPDSPKDNRYYTHSLVGSSRGARPVIKLKNNCSGFTASIGSVGSPSEVNKTKPVVHFAAFRDDNGNLAWDSGEPDNGGNSFFNCIRNIDFNLGTGNTSAFAIEMLGAQQCAIEDVKITATGAFGGIRDIPGTASATGNIEVVNGRVGIYGSGQHSTAIAGVKLIDQTEYAYFHPGSNPVLLVGFQIRKAGAPAIRQDSSATPYGGDMAFIDGSIEFTSAPNGATAFENPNGHGVYMHNVFVKNATTLIKSGSRAAVAGRNGWKKILEYACSDSNTSVAGYNLINGTTNANEYKTDIFDANESDVPANLVSRHTWNRADFPSPDDIYDRVHTDHDPTVAIATEHGVVADDSQPSVTADCTGPDNRAAIQTLIDAGYKIIFFPKGKYLVKKNPAGNYGLMLGMETTLIGINHNYSELRTHDDWNPTAEVPLVTTPNDANASCKMALLKLGFVHTPLANDWFNAYDWRAGKNSVTLDVWVRAMGGDSTKNATQDRADQVFSGNAGGRHYGVSAGGQMARDSAKNGFRRVRVQGTSQPLAIYNADPEDDLDKPQVLVTGCQNVIFYGTKAEDQLGFGFKNSSNCGIFVSGGRAEVEFDNCTNSIAGIIAHKQKSTPFNSSTLRETGSSTPKNAPCGVFKRGTFDWSKVEIVPPAAENGAARWGRYE